MISLPAELIDSILEYLSPLDLNHVSETCRALYSRATADHLWQALVQENIPGLKITSSYPCADFRELFGAHDPRWFLPKYKIWFSDTDLPGRLIVVQYDERRGCIEGYQLVANNKSRGLIPWQGNHEVVISAFDPEVKLHLDHPILRLPANPTRNPHARHTLGTLNTITLRRERTVDESGASTSQSIWREVHPVDPPLRSEIPMQLRPPDNMHNNFMHARRLDPADAAARLRAPFPYGDVWPTPAIPSPDRVASTGLHAATAQPNPAGDCPTSRDNLSTRAFRIRKWLEVRLARARNSIVAGHETTTSPMELSAHWINPLLAIAAEEAEVDVDLDQVIDADHLSLPMGVHIGEEVATYATLDPGLYTPTPEKPYRGIWVGDYSSHGCEFLWVNQTDGDDGTQGEVGKEGEEGSLEGGLEAGWVSSSSGEGGGSNNNSDSSDGSSESPPPARRQRRSPRKRERLEAVKLTGDANIPRGEYSFVVDDLGPGGFVEVATEPPFEGVRVVRSRGHVAGSGFFDGEFYFFFFYSFWGVKLLSFFSGLWRVGVRGWEELGMEG